MEKLVDTTRFLLKSQRVKIAFAQGVQKALAQSAQEVMDRTLKNLSGAEYLKGQLPVRRVTGTLARSMRMIPMSIVQWAIWSDPKIAHYGKYVHDGTQKLRPRRFLGDVVKERRTAIQNRIRFQVLKAIRSEGQR